MTTHSSITVNVIFGYAVFGEVTEGMDVVDKIVSVQTGTVGPFRDVPNEPIIINSAKVVD